MRLRYAIALFCLLAVEVCIALFVRDWFIRPYGGDVLVTVLLCCFCRMVYPGRRTRIGKTVPVAVFCFALGVEIGQYFDLVGRLGLGGSRFFRILVGSTFSVADVVCYAGGCLLFWIVETVVLRLGEYWQNE